MTEKKTEEKETEGKEWYKSKVLWTNVAIITVGVIQWSSGEYAAGATITVAGVANAILRTITKHKIQF